MQKKYTLFLLFILYAINISAGLKNDIQTDPSINIFSPVENQVFPSETTSVTISYDILNFPSFTPGADGSVVYSVRENGDFTSTNIEITDVSFSISTRAGVLYEVIVEARDIDGNSFNPRIMDTVTFSVAEATNTTPELVITSPIEGQIFPSETSSVSIAYEVLNFPDFDVANSFIEYTRSSGSNPNTFTTTQAASIGFGLSVSSGESYFVRAELLDANRNSYSPAIVAVVNFSIAEAIQTPPTLTITSPQANTVFDTSQQVVTVAYTITDPSDTILLGENASIIYTIEENGTTTTIRDDYFENSFTVPVTAGNSYTVTVELVDGVRNSFMPAARETISFSVAEATNTTPELVITSPTEGQVFPSETSSVSIAYEVLNFPDFDAANSFIEYTRSSGSNPNTFTTTQAASIGFGLSVSSGESYFVRAELLDANRNSYSPAIVAIVNFSIAEATQTPPTLTITSPQANTVFDATQQVVTVAYTITDLSDMIVLGENASILYTIEENGTTTIIRDDYFENSFTVPVTAGNSYTVSVELVDGARNSFMPAAKETVSFSVAEATNTTPELVITSPTEGQVFPTETGNVTISYDILNFPGFTPGVDGTVVYSVRENADFTLQNIEVTDAAFGLVTRAGTIYDVTVEARDINGNSFNPRIMDTVTFSVAEATNTTPELMITSPTEGQVFPSETSSVSIAYEVLNFPDFDVANSFIEYTRSSGSNPNTFTTTQAASIGFGLSVTGGESYFVRAELLDANRNSYSPAIVAVVNFSIAEATQTPPTLTITSPQANTVFDATQQVVTVAYTITDPSDTILLGENASIIYTIEENGVTTIIRDDYFENSFTVPVTAGNSYTVTVELVDGARNSFMPAAKETVSFSILSEEPQLPPSISIKSPTRSVLSPIQNNVSVTYEILNFPAFTPGVDGLIKYTVFEDGTTIINVENGMQVTPIEFDVKGGSSYQVAIELLQNDGTPFNSRIVNAINLFKQTDYRAANTLREIRTSDNQTYYQLLGQAVVTYADYNNLVFFVEDETGAFMVKDEVGTFIPNILVGDLLTNLRGFHTENGSSKVFLIEDFPELVSRNNSTPTPTRLTFQEILANRFNYESQLITVTNARFVDADGVARFDRENKTDYLITNDNGDELLFTLQLSGTDLDGSLIPEGTFDITGIFALPQASSRGVNNLPMILATNLSNIVLNVNEENFSDNTISIYPNPVNLGTLSFKTSNANVKKIQIFNILGKEVYASTITNANHDVDVSGIASGVYLVKIAEGKKSIMKKVIVQN